ncbi:MAG TPA: hypothetical protein DDY31_13270 [Lachnospiraceae bacterium]|nr:hypothetical protein [Lachnospiraceae bacterium]
MIRLNKEAPNYFEGYLSNGKPITEENITAMIESAKVSMPQGTTWNTDDKYDYRSFVIDDRGANNVGGCGSFSASLSDYIFGKDAPVIRHQNFDQLKVGDVIWMKDSSTGADHVFMVTGFGNNKYIGDYFSRGEGNANSVVHWDVQDYIFRWSATKLAESYIYSRY